MPVVWINQMKKNLQDLESPFVNAKDSGSPGKTETSPSAAVHSPTQDLQDFQDTCADFHDDFPDTQAGALQH